MQSDPLITIDNRMTLSEAARMAGVSPSAVFRWAREGRRGVRLQTAELGKRLFTSKPALTKYMNEVAEAREADAAVA